MRQLFRYYRPKEYFWLLAALVFVFFQVYFNLKLPDYMSEITQLVETEGSRMADIRANGWEMIKCAFAALMMAVISSYIVTKLSATLTYRVRRQLYEHITKFGMAEMNHFSESSLLTRSTNDITQIQLFLSMGMQLMMLAPVTAIWAVTKIWNKSWEWSALTGLAVVILLAVIIILMKFVVPKFKIIQKLTDALNQNTRENLIGLRVIRAFNAEAYQEKKFEHSNEDVTNVQMFTQKALATLQPIMYLVMYFLTLGIYLIGANLIQSAMMADKLSLFGDMVVFSSYALQIIFAFLMLAAVFMMMPRAQVSAARIKEVIDMPLSIQEDDFDGETDEKGTVEFKNVTFRYPGAEEPILKNISFKIKKGQTFAFVGSTGSGKSTLIQLIPRFYDVTEGQVLVDGVDVRSYRQNALYDKIGYVFQKSMLFNGTIRENIAIGEKPCSDEQIQRALKIAQADDFVARKSGLDTPVAQRGANFSGGQKQRLAIARAVAKDPEIYVFDDSFSALDYQTDAALRRALKENCSSATVLIVAQRIGTVLNADQIVVLEQGECVGIGTHKELMETCDVYREIALSQLSKEELEHASHA
ncbi:ABC transporter ATP-binding protein [Catenisphaera adipataccumulans]|uniref:ATP-binding cassette subfamily B protein n=1 Tax=Catenisphaera adipataccumulans TaxID=700500 RepID=A0A7W8D0E5_9FIRM|nr:ABC transporter ATP-binding protein [Catenisphaera adipataccumulans]MBB5183798.1 ATP-binding cassette subfamily B protein [Catenisphaera adipataccumulans]